MYYYSGDFHAYPSSHCWVIGCCATKCLQCDVLFQDIDDMMPEPATCRFCMPAPAYPPLPPRPTYNGVLRYDADVLKYLEADPIPPSKRLFGVELEVISNTSSQRTADEIRSSFGDDVIVKSDSSINPYAWGHGGIEIVTRPMTLENQVSFWERFLSKKNPIKNNLYVNRSCGLHVHVSKQGITNLPTLLWFVNRSEWNNKITKAAGRQENRYCVYGSRPYRAYLSSPTSGNKYTAVNTTKPSTIEFRIFRSTLGERTVPSVVEFVESVVQFSETFDPVDDGQENGWRNYVSFMENKGFKKAYNLLKRRNLLCV